MAALTAIGTAGTAFGNAGTGFAVADSYPPYGLYPYAPNFLRATGITNTTQANAITRLVQDLVAAGQLHPRVPAMSKLRVLYPLVGGTAAAHSINLVDVSAYAATWHGNPTHTANGVQPNGIDQYADTNLPASAIDPHDSHIAFYADQAVADENRGGQGVAGRAASQDRDFLLSYNRGNLSLYVSANDNALVAYSQPQTLAGLLIGTRTSSSDARLYHNGSQVGASTALDYSLMPTGTILFGAAQEGTTSRVPFSFFSVGAGLSSAEQLPYYQAIQTYQAALNRAR